VTTARSLSLRAAITVTAASWLAAMPARAQPARATSAPDSPVLEEIVVTGDRRGSYSADLVQAGSFRGARQLDTPLTVNVITNGLIQSQQAQSLLDALRNTAGVSASQTSVTVYSNLAIRGITVENRGNYRLNGILPIVNLIDLPLEDKDRVEALKGASALYYGFSTPAGIVNLTMKRPTPDPYVATTLFGNQFGSVAAHVDASNTWGRVGARLNAVYGSVDSGIDDTRGRRELFAAAFDYKPVESVTVTVDAETILKRVNEPGVYRYISLPTPSVTNLYPALELPPLLDPSVNFGPDWASSRAEERNLLAGVSWKISPAWAFSASYGNSHIVRDRHFNTIDLTTYGPDTNGNGALSIGLQPGATFENSNSRVEIGGAFRSWFMTHQLLLGASKNIRHAFTSTTVPATCPGATSTAPRVPCAQNIFDPVDIPETPFAAPRGARARIDDIGYYLFDRIQVTNRLHVLVGVRKADYTETNVDTGAVTFADEPTSISYGVVVKPSQRLSVYGTYIEGLESTPAAPMTAANALATLPATDSTQREAGIKLELRPGLLIQAAYFAIERGSAFVDGANLYVLDGRARFRGVEVSVTGEVTQNWSLYASGQRLYAEQISGADTLITTDPATGVATVVPTVVGRKIENTPERTFSLASEYRLSGLLPGFSLNGAAYYVSERAVNPFNQAFIPSYTLFDLGVAYTRPVRGMEATIRVTGQNIADKKHFSSTGGNVIAQGPPRAVKLSVTTRF
jgi:iron complex outermembrane recepter protein